jgi:HJR/Mrr/RecB family endonuclease
MREGLLSKIMPIAKSVNIVCAYHGKARSIDKPTHFAVPMLSRNVSQRRYRVSLLQQPSPSNNLVTLQQPSFSSIFKPFITSPVQNIAFAFLSVVRIVGKRFAPKDRGQSQLAEGSETKSSRIKYMGRSRKPRPEMVNTEDHLWDTIYIVLQPPLDLNLPTTIDLPEPLYPFQIEGVCFLTKTHPGALLADDMGLGKTVQTIVALRCLFQSAEIERALVVCRLSNLRHWEAEFKKWAPLLRLSVCYGLFETREQQWQMPAHVYLTTYDVIREDIEVINSLDGLGYKSSFDVITLDEISNIKNASAKRSQAIKKLTKRQGWGLSGTPVENSLNDLFSIFGFLNPDLFRNVSIEAEDDIKNKLKNYMLRRRKADVLQDLPPKICHDVWVDLTPTQRRAYEQAYTTGVVELRRGMELQKVTTQHILSLLTRLKQICNIEPRTHDSGKLEWLEDNLEEMTVDGKFLIFSQYKDEGIYAIYHHLTQQERRENQLLRDEQVLMYSGDLSQTQRATAESQFNADPESKALLLTFGAGAHGLNLQAANYVVLFDHWWNPAVMQQAEDRAHRLGQKRRVIVYRLWIKDTVEERIYEILQRKRDLYDHVIDSLAVKGVGDSGLTERELFSLFDLEPPHRDRQNGHKWTVEDLLSLEPRDFEDLTARLWEAMDFETHTTPGSADEGIDVIAIKDDPDNPQRIAIQCKRHRNPVGRPDAQRLIGAISGDPRYNEAILIGVSGFTQQCREYGRHQGQLRLLDGQRLCDMLNDIELKQ